MFEKSPESKKFNPMIFIDRNLAPRLPIKELSKEIFLQYQKWNRQEIERLRQIKKLSSWEKDLVDKLCQELQDEELLLASRVQDSRRYTQIFNRIQNLAISSEQSDSSTDSETSSDSE